MVSSLRVAQYGALSHPSIHPSIQSPKVTTRKFSQEQTLAWTGMIYLQPVLINHSLLYLPSKALSLAMTESLNFIISVVPLCQWAVTLAGKPLCVRMASTMPAVKAAQFKLLFSLGTEMYALISGSFSMM